MTTSNVSRRGFLKGALAAGAGLAGAGAMTTTANWFAEADTPDGAYESTAYTYHNEHCLCNCMLECTVRGGRLCMVKPRPNEDRRFHNICLKGISEIEHIYGDSRIQTPLRRVGERGEGVFEQISWDEAFSLIADGLKAAQQSYGKESVWVQFSTESQQRLPPLLPTILGAQTSAMNGYDMGQGNGQGQAFGWSGMFAENTIWDWPNARVVIMANCNLIETSLVWSRGMLDAQKAGTKFIVLDPRFSPTAGKADQWVGLRAGTDPAFFLGMTNYILQKDLYDEDHCIKNTALPALVNPQTGEVLGEMEDAIDPKTGAPAVDEKTGAVKRQKHPYVWDATVNAAVRIDRAQSPVLEGTFTVDGVVYETQFSLLREQMKDYTLDWAASVCDIDASVIADVAEQYAKGPSIIANGVGGIDKFSNNDVAGHCYALVATLTGNYGKRGTGCGIYGYHVTPWNVQLGTWPLPEGVEPATPKMGFYDMVHKDMGIHAALFFGDIPTQKSANWAVTEAWLQKLDFVAIADVYHSSVVDYADVVLPACSKFESIDEIGGLKNANGYILTNQKVLDPLFEAKPDFYIEKGIADAMGLGDLMPKDSVAYAKALLDTPDPLVAGITLDTLKQNTGAQHLVGTGDIRGDEVGMTYATPSGKQEPYYENLVSFGQAFPAWEAPNEAYPENPLRAKYPLQFGQSRSRFRVRSTYSGAKWIQQFYEPHIELNAAEAAARGLADGDTVEVFNDRGSFTTKLRINEAIRPESTFMVESSYKDFLGGTLMQSVSNDAINERGYVLPFGPMIPFNDTLVEIKKASE
jgi:molybdopterin-containing oxidoreductase family molybdopterin binding subunit